MKKVLSGFIAIASMAMISCQQDEQLAMMNDTNEVYTGVVEAPESRTTLGEDGSVVWSDNDVISIFTKNGYHYKYKVEKGGSTIATFKYADESTKPGVNLSQNYAVYPYSSNHNISSEGTFTLNLELLANQTYTESSFENGKSVMTSKSDNTDFSFYNVLSMLRVQLKSVPEGFYSIKSITLTSKSTTLNGTATVDMNSDKQPAVFTSGTKSTKLTCTSPVELTEDYTDFYILVPVAELAAGDLNIEVEAWDILNEKSVVYKADYPETLSFVRSKYTTIYHDFVPDDFTGTIEPDYSVSTLEALQAAVDAAQDGETIVLTEDITGDITVTQKPDVKITIEGNGHTFAGVILVDGKSATYTTAGLTLNNLNFEAESISADACITLGKYKDNNTRYTCNVTVNECTFNVPGAVGIKSYTGGDKNLTITNCSATEVAHSLIQAKGIDGILVEKCNVYSKNGLNFNNSNNVTVDNCTADVKGYAVRFGESSGGSGEAETYIIKNSTLKSANDEGDAVVIVRGTADNSTLTLTNTTLEGNPAINNTATNATIIIDGNYYVTTADELASAITAGEKNVTLTGTMTLDSNTLKGAEDLNINLEANTNVTISSGAMGGSNFTFTGDKSSTITFVNTNPGYEGALAYHDNANLTFKGITFDASQISGICARGGVVTFEDCKISGELEKTIASKFVFTKCTFTVGVTQVGYGCSDVAFENCTFETDGYGIKIYSEGNTPVNLNVTGCSFKNTNDATAKSAIFLDHIIDGITYSITVDNCTFEGYTATPTPNENKWAERMIVEDSFVKTDDGQHIFSYQTGAEGGNWHKILTDTQLVVTVK